MNYAVLKNELQTDPEGIGYDGTGGDDAGDAAKLNAENRQRNRATMSGAEVFDNFDATEYAALADGQKQQVLSLCAISSLDPFGVGAQIIAATFPAAGATITALQSARVETISRATELGLGFVRESDVWTALNLQGI